MDLYGQALRRFGALFEQAREVGLREPTAVTLATADAAGRPSIRTVLLKDFDPRGFVFYTNHRSRKGRELHANPRAALLFFWQPIFEQVQVEGPVETVSDAEADAYWATRPRDSRIGAWASQQSEPLDSRETLERRVAELERRWLGEEIPRPPHWSGFRVIPDRIEFWRPGEARLHERTCYTRGEGGWTVTLLNP